MLLGSFPVVVAFDEYITILIEKARNFERDCFENVISRKVSGFEEYPIDAAVVGDNC